MHIEDSIFKAYDIRGIVDQTLTEEVVEAVGLVLGYKAKEAGQMSFCVGRDGRLSGQRLSQALIKGLLDSGIDVIDIGMVPTPVLYFATQYFKNGSGVAVTGSHNPPEYNGLKMMIAGKTLFSDEIKAVASAIKADQYEKQIQKGTLKQVDISQEYLQDILSKVRLSRPMKVVVDAGNGVAGPMATRLLQGMGAEVTELYTNIDGTFPNHHPDPSKLENLKDLIAAVSSSKNELGLAFDGDGDRLGVVTHEGNVIFPDRQLMLFAEDILSTHPGAQIVYDVKCTRRLVDWIKVKGGVPVISKTGHSLVKAKLRETKAPLAGEMSGHLFFNDERWYGFDDGVYAAARLLEILSKENDASAKLNRLPSAENTPELQIAVPEGENHKIVAMLQENMTFPDAQEIIKIDGIRVEWNNGFALVRASNTTPVLVLRLEGDTSEALDKVTALFRAELERLCPELKLPF